MKKITSPFKYLLTILSLSAFIVNTYAADNSDKNTNNNVEPGVNYLLPIGFQMAPISKNDSSNSPEKDSSVITKAAKAKVPAKKRIYKVDINPEFSHSTIRKTEEAFKQAELYEADYILIHMDADNPEAENTTYLIQSKLGIKSRPVFFYVDSKKSPNRSLLTITQNDSALGNSTNKAYNVHQYHFNAKQTAKNKLAKAPKNISFTEKTDISLNPLDNATTGSLITDILHNNNLSNFDVVQYNPGKYGKIIDLLTQRWVCMLFVALLTALMIKQLKTREAGLHSFLIISVMIVMIGALYEERLAGSNEIILIVLGVLLLFSNLFIRKNNAWNILLCTGSIFAISGLALTLTSYNTNPGLFITQLSINILLISASIISTIKIYTLINTLVLNGFFTTKKRTILNAISEV